MTALQLVTVIAGPVLLGLLAVGVVLRLKIARRRQGTRDPSLTEAVPVLPLSSDDARKMWRRYLWSAAGITGVLMLAAVLATQHR